MSQKFRIAGLVCAALVCLAGGYVLGRYAAPARVVVTEKVREVERQVVVTQTKTEVQVVRVADVQKDVHRERVIERRPDGSVTVTTKEDDRSKEHVDARSNAKAETSRVEERLVYRDREITKLVERARPQWALALQPGFATGEALGLGGSSFNLLAALPVRHLMANVAVERRVLGPVFVGAWANTRLDAGLSFRVEW